MKINLKVGKVSLTSNLSLSSILSHGLCNRLPKNQQWSKMLKKWSVLSLFFSEPEWTDDRLTLLHPFLVAYYPLLTRGPAESRTIKSKFHGTLLLSVRDNGARGTEHS